MPKASRPGCLRPRVEGAREQEILHATLHVLSEVGYDRLTMDQVAREAHASKATLYRRWSSKVQLVIEALSSVKQHQPEPDTGSLRQDLIEHFGQGDLTDAESINLFGAVLTAVACDNEFAAAFRAGFLAPKIAASRVLFERAQQRGEIRRDVDLDLISPALPGIVLHRHYVLGEPPTPELVAQVIDQILLPAITAPSAQLASATIE